MFFPCDIFMTRVFALSVTTGRVTILYNLQLVALDISSYFITYIKLTQQNSQPTVLPLLNTLLNILLNILCFKVFLVSII